MSVWAGVWADEVWGSVWQEDGGFSLLSSSVSVWADGVWACWAEGVWFGMGGSAPAPVVVQQTGAGNLNWLKKRKRKTPPRWSDVKEEVISIPAPIPIVEEEEDEDEILMLALTRVLQ